VVIGIIALLIAILLPTLNRAREAGKSVQCLSNLRQLSQATMMFATENKGWMPGQAGGGVLIRNPNASGLGFKGGINAQAASTEEAWDWVAWQREIDPVTGVVRTGKNAWQNITLSGLAKYMGQKPVFGLRGAEANAVARNIESVFRCPSDILEARPKMDPGEAYRYSYSINQMVATNSGNPPVLDGWHSTAGARPAGMGRDARSWGRFNGKLQSIKKASEIILFVCEDEHTLADGAFSARLTL
jgi:type II secretory pathway pseudopilin PulG